MKPNLKPICILLPALFAAPSAYAQSCSLTIDSLNFGKVDLMTQQGANSAAQIHIGCDGKAGESLALCLNIGEGSWEAADNGNTRQMSMGDPTNKLKYQLYENDRHGQIWGSYNWGYAARPPEWMATFGSDGKLSTSKTLYGKAWGVEILPEGTYSSNFAGHVTLNTAYSKVATDCRSSSATPATASFMVTAEIAKECLVEASPLDFGQSSLLSGYAPPAQAQISVKCTQGTSYAIGLEEGQHSPDKVTRRMKRVDNQTGTSTKAEYVNYELYSDGGYTQRWGGGLGTAPDVVVGKPADGKLQPYTVFGRVEPRQEKPAGLYTDTVTVTVHY